MAQNEGRAPGWDAKQIAKIATDHYGSYAKMFEAHHWPERGSEMMRFAQKRVAETYGSVEAFVKKHAR